MSVDCLYCAWGEWTQVWLVILPWFCFWLLSARTGECGWPNGTVRIWHSSGKGRKGTILETDTWTAMAGGLLSPVTPLGYTTLQPHCLSDLLKNYQRSTELRSQVRINSFREQQDMLSSAFPWTSVHSSPSIKCCFVCDSRNLVRLSQDDDCTLSFIQDTWIWKSMLLITRHRQNA